ncbi:MAG: hypothetical protein PHG68_02780, partial [Candidatus Omnitrophica bacterium]|nr:hypothetical protein [Candidatus Omnitrophota bacterium]
MAIIMATSSANYPALQVENSEEVILLSELPELINFEQEIRRIERLPALLLRDLESLHDIDSRYVRNKRILKLLLAAGLYKLYSNVRFSIFHVLRYLLSRLALRRVRKILGTSGDQHLGVREFVIFDAVLYGSILTGLSRRQNNLVAAIHSLSEAELMHVLDVVFPRRNYQETSANFERILNYIKVISSIFDVGRIFKSDHSSDGKGFFTALKRFLSVVLHFHEWQRISLNTLKPTDNLAIAINKVAYGLNFTENPVNAEAIFKQELISNLSFYFGPECYHEPSFNLYNPVTGLRRVFFRRNASVKEMEHEIIAAQGGLTHKEVNELQAIIADNLQNGTAAFQRNLPRMVQLVMRFGRFRPRDFTSTGDFGESSELALRIDQADARGTQELVSEIAQQADTFIILLQPPLPEGKEGELSKPGDQYVFEERVISRLETGLRVPAPAIFCIRWIIDEFPTNIWKHCRDNLSESETRDVFGIALVRIDAQPGRVRVELICQDNGGGVDLQQLLTDCNRSVADMLEVDHNRGIYVSTQFLFDAFSEQDAYFLSKGKRLNLTGFDDEKGVQGKIVHECPFCHGLFCRVAFTINYGDDATTGPEENSSNDGTQPETPTEERSLECTPSKTLPSEKSSQEVREFSSRQDFPTGTPILVSSLRTTEKLRVRPYTADGGRNLAKAQERSFSPRFALRSASQTPGSTDQDAGDSGVSQADAKPIIFFRNAKTFSGNYPAWMQSQEGEDTPPNEEELERLNRFFGGKQHLAELGIILSAENVVIRPSLDTPAKVVNGTLYVHSNIIRGPPFSAQIEEGLKTIFQGHELGHLLGENEAQARARTINFLIENENIACHVKFLRENSLGIIPDPNWLYRLVAGSANPAISDSPAYIIDKGFFKEILCTFVPSQDLDDKGQFVDCLEQLNRLLEKGTFLAKPTVLLRAASQAEYEEKKQAYEALIAEHLPENIPTFSFIAQAPLNYPGVSVLLEAVLIQPFADRPIEVRYPNLSGTNYRYTVVDPCHWVYAAGITDSTKQGTLEQSEQAFILAEKILAQEGLHLGHIKRQWNFIEDIVGIVHEQGEDKQKYQIFNDVRHKHYAQVKFEAGYPAATGIGQYAGGVILELIAFDASDKSRYIVQGITNLRQVSAFQYGQQVLVGKASAGLKQKAAPQFSRGYVVLVNKGKKGWWRKKEWVGWCYVSGTASITGHHSQYVSILGADFSEEAKKELDQVLAKLRASAFQGRFIHLLSLRVALASSKPEEYAQLKKEIEKVRLVKTEKNPHNGTQLWSVVFPDEKTIFSKDASFFWAAGGSEGNDWIGESIIEQTRMTRANIEYLVSAENIMHAENLGRRRLHLVAGTFSGALAHIRKYLKYPGEFARSHATWKNDAEEISDVCRPNLTVEIECEGGLEVTHAYPLLVSAQAYGKFGRVNQGEGILGWMGKDLTGKIKFTRRGEIWAHEPVSAGTIAGITQEELDRFLSLVNSWSIAEELPKYLTEFFVVITTDVTRLHETSPALRQDGPFIATTEKSTHTTYFHPWAIKLANTSGMEPLVDDFITHELGELTQNHQQVCDRRFAFYRNNPKRLMQLLENIQQGELEIAEEYLDGLLAVALETNCFVQVAAKMLSVTPRQLARVFLGYSPSSKAKLDNPRLKIRLEDIRPDVSRRKVLIRLKKALEIFQGRYPENLVGAARSRDGSGIWMLYFSNLRLYPEGDLCTAATAYLTLKSDAVWHMDEAEVFVSGVDIERDEDLVEIEDLIDTLHDTDYVGAGESAYILTIAISWWAPVSVLVLGIVSLFLGLDFWLNRPVSQKTAERIAVAIRSMGHTPGTLVMDALRDAVNALENLDEELRALSRLRSAKKYLVVAAGLPGLHNAINPATGKRYAKAGRLHRLWDEVREVTQQRLPKRYEVIKWFLMLLVSGYEINRSKRKLRKLLESRVTAGSSQRVLLRRAYGLVKYAEEIIRNRLELFLGRQNPVVVSLATFLKLIRQAVAYKFGDQFRIEVCEGVQDCMVRIPGKMELKNAIANCIENASRAVFKTLTVSKFTSMDADTQSSFERDNIRIVVRMENGALTVCVMDRGVGIEAEGIQRGPDARYPVCRLNASSQGQGHGLGMTETELAFGAENLDISSLTIEALVATGLLPVRREMLEEISRRAYLLPALKTFIHDAHMTLEHLTQIYTHNIGAMGNIGGVNEPAVLKELPRDILRFRKVMGKILGGMQAHFASLEVIDEMQPVLIEYMLNILEGCYQSLNDLTQHAKTPRQMPLLDSEDSLSAQTVYHRYMALLEVLRRLDSGERVSVGTTITMRMPIVKESIPSGVRTYPLVVPKAAHKRLVSKFSGERDLARVRFYKDARGEWIDEIQWHYSAFPLIELQRLIGLMKNNLNRAPPEDRKEFLLVVTTKPQALGESGNADSRNVYFGTTQRENNRINIHPWAIELAQEVREEPAIRLLFQDFLRHELEELETGSHINACLKSILYFSQPKNRKKLKILLDFFKMRKLALNPIYMSQLLKIAMEDNCATQVLAEATKYINVDYPRTAEKLIDRIQAGLFTPRLTLDDVIFTDKGVLADLPIVLFAIMEQYINPYTGFVLNSEFDQKNAVVYLQIFAYQDTHIIEIRRGRDNIWHAQIIKTRHKFPADSGTTGIAQAIEYLGGLRRRQYVGKSEAAAHTYPLYVPQDKIEMTNSVLESNMWVSPIYTRATLCSVSALPNELRKLNIDEDDFKWLAETVINHPKAKEIIAGGNYEFAPRIRDAQFVITNRSDLLTDADGNVCLGAVRVEANGQITFFLHPWYFVIAGTPISDEPIIDDFWRHEITEAHTGSHILACRESCMFFQEHSDELKTFLKSLQSRELEVSPDYAQGLLTLALTHNCLIQAIARALGQDEIKVAKKFAEAEEKIAISDLRFRGSSIYMPLTKALRIMEKKYYIYDQNFDIDHSGSYIIELEFYEPGIPERCGRIQIDREDDRIHFHAEVINVEYESESVPRESLDDFMTLLSADWLIGGKKQATIVQKNGIGYFGNLLIPEHVQFIWPLIEQNKWQELNNFNGALQLVDGVPVVFRQLTEIAQRTPPHYIYARRAQDSRGNYLIDAPLEIYFSSAELVQAFSQEFPHDLSLGLEAIAFHEIQEVLLKHTHEEANQLTQQRYSAAYVRLQGLFASIYFVTTRPAAGQNVAIRRGEGFDVEVLVNASHDTLKENLSLAVHSNIDTQEWHDIVIDQQDIHPGVDASGNPIPGIWFAKVTITPEHCGHYEFTSRAKIITQGDDWHWPSEKNVFLQVHNLPDWVDLQTFSPYYLYIPDVVRLGFPLNWTGIKDFILHAHETTGRNAFVLSPFFPTSDEGPFAPLSVFALHPRLVDWDAVPDAGEDALGKFRSFKADASIERHMRFSTFRQIGHLLEYALLIATRVYQGKEECVYGVRYTVTDFSSEQEAIEFLLYEQFVGFEQLTSLLSETRREKIDILGDLPFYRSQEGVDVACRRHYFVPGNAILQEWIALLAVKISVLKEIKDGDEAAAAAGRSEEEQKQFSPYIALAKSMREFLPSVEREMERMRSFLPAELRNKLGVEVVPGMTLAELIRVEPPGHKGTPEQIWGNLVAWDEKLIDKLVQQGQKDPRMVPFEYWDAVFSQVMEADTCTRIRGWRLDALHMYGRGAYKDNAERQVHSTLLWDNIAEFFSSHKLFAIVEQLGADGFSFEHFKKLGFIQYAFILDLKPKNLETLVDDLYGISRGIAFGVADTHDSPRWAREYALMFEYLANTAASLQAKLNSQESLALIGPAFLGLLSLGPRMDTTLLCLGEYGTVEPIKAEIRDEHGVTVLTKWGTQELGRFDFCSCLRRFAQ